MINVHASLLPKWRGAAPIVYALANGDKKTGVTIMRIKPRKFDVGEIVKQAEIEITDDMQMPELYEKLANLGSNLLLEVVNTLPDALLAAKEQNGKVTLGKYLVVHIIVFTHLFIYWKFKRSLRCSLGLHNLLRTERAKTLWSYRIIHDA